MITLIGRGIHDWGSLNNVIIISYIYSNNIAIESLNNLETSGCTCLKKTPKNYNFVYFNVWITSWYDISFRFSVQLFKNHVVLTTERKLIRNWHRYSLHYYSTPPHIQSKHIFRNIKTLYSAVQLFLFIWFTRTLFVIDHWN